jgi:hypothetical protein
VQFGLKAGYFMPGKAFEKDPVNNRKAASQLIVNAKVTKDYESSRAESGGDR